MIIHLDQIDVVGLSLTDNGRSLQIKFVDFSNPSELQALFFANICHVGWHQSKDQSFPFTVFDLVCDEIPAQQRQKVFSEIKYPFMGQSGELQIPTTPLVLTHFEGDIVGDVISESVYLEAVGG